jgi:hypothetical protein
MSKRLTSMLVKFLPDDSVDILFKLSDKDTRRRHSEVVQEFIAQLVLFRDWHKELGTCTECGGTGAGKPTIEKPDGFPCSSCGGKKL